MIQIDRIKKAILDENLSGWLFFNFRHRDPISDSILEINKSSINSRGWFYIVFPWRKPLKIVHRVEKNMLDHLPGEKTEYSSRKELLEILSQFKESVFAVQSDINLTTLSYMDGGTEELIKSAGITTKSAASLIQRYSGILDNQQIKSHKKAADILYKIIEETWDIIKKSFSRGEMITETFLADYIHECFEKNNLVTEHRILVAFGRNTSDPHYETGKSDSILTENTLIQFDIWAKEKKEKSVYSDISWVAYTGTEVPETYRSVFSKLTEARDNAVHMISENLSSGINISGSEVDAETRKILIDAGYSEAIHHRTGHAIDIELHGYGVNIDSIEFPDSRIILEHSCFSIEPGLYFSDFGMRTEIDCCIIDNEPVITGKEPQKKILTL